MPQGDGKKSQNQTKLITEGFVSRIAKIVHIAIGKQQAAGFK
jgi:hypothetical protein